MFGVFLAATIQLDTLSVPGPRGVVTDYQVHSTSAAPAYGSYTPAATPAGASTPTTPSVANAPTTTIGASQVIVPVSVPSAALSPEALLNELQAGEPQRTLVDTVRDLLPASTVSPVGVFDRVISGPVQQQTQSSATPASLSSTTAAYTALVSSCVQGALFTRTVRLGAEGDDVRLVQRFLNAVQETRLGDVGAGSPGNETNTFAGKTFGAVKKFQALYAADILTPLGLSAPTGEWGAKTRAKANQLVCGTK